MAERVERHREEPDRHLLAGGEEHVHLAGIGRRRHRARRARRGASVVLPIAETTTTMRWPWAADCATRLRDVHDLLGVGDRGAAVFLHDQLAHETPILHDAARPPTSA